LQSGPIHEEVFGQSVDEFERSNHAKSADGDGDICDRLCDVGRAVVVRRCCPRMFFERPQVANLET